jgi:predicted permease
LVLLTGAGLLFNSFLRLEAVDPGFRTAGLAVVPLMLDDDRYNEEQVGRFVDRVVERARALPGAREAAVAWTYPFQWADGGRCCWQTNAFKVDGEARDVRVTVEPITDDYFATLGMSVRGRTFRPGDEHVEPIPVILPTTVATAMFGDTGGSAIGRTFTMREDLLQVVGVVEPHRHWGLADADANMMFVPYQRFGRRFGMVGLMVRTAGDPGALLPALRQMIWAMEPNLPIGEVFTMSDRIQTSLAGPRFYMSLLMTFAVVALLLAAGGIYGAMLYAVGQRRRELGIRVALGAGRARVLGMVVGQGAVLAAAGVALGIGGAYFLTRTLQAFVFGIGTTDGPTFAVMAAVLAAVAVGATLVPARRAAESDPVEALRSE